MHDHFLGKDNCEECLNNKRRDYILRYPEFSTRELLLTEVIENKKLRKYLFTRLDLLRAIFEDVKDVTSSKRLWGRLHLDLKTEIESASDILGIADLDIRNQLIGFYRNVVKNYVSQPSRNRDNPYDVIVDREALAFMIDREK